MTQRVTLKIADGLAHIRLSWPEAGNAMDWAMIDALASACAAVAQDRTVRAVLIGAEGRTFCVGGDIRAFAGEADPGAFIEKLAHRLHDSISTLATLDAPVVAAVQGAAAGAGLSLAASCDVVIAGEGAVFALAYAGIGLTSDGGATWTLPRLIGLRRAQDMALLGRRLSASEALDWGLVTRVVADDRLDAEAVAVARALAAGPTRALGGIKRLFRTGQDAPFGDHLAAEAKAIGDALRTQDAQGAMKAFLAREKPLFTGQ